MQRLKKAVPVFVILVMAVMLLMPTASAAVKGNLTFYHGVKPELQYTYARTTSTAYENSMDFVGLLNFTYPYNQTWSVWSGYQYNTKDFTFDVDVSGSRGNSSFDYYVDDIYQHSSTAPWPFDFT